MAVTDQCQVMAFLKEYFERLTSVQCLFFFFEIKFFHLESFGVLKIAYIDCTFLFKDLTSSQ